MSVSAAEAGPSAHNVQLEAVPALDTTDGTSSESAAAAAAPRRGTRARKPTSKAAGVDAAEAAAVQEAQQASTRSAKKRKADELAADTAVDPDAINNEVAQVFEAASGHASDADDDEDDKQYCICRGKDDGTFMISCERCQEWFHTKCIGITQKAAKKLDEYVCESCSQADTKKTSAKPSKRYKSSAKKKATSPQEPHDDEMESDDAQNEDEASDGDEYIGEQGENASDAEGAAKEEASSSTKPARTRRLQRLGVDASQATDKLPDSPSSDTEIRSKPSQGARRPSGPAKSTSGGGPKKGGPRRPTGPTDASTEDARSRARKVLATALENIFATHDSESASEDAEVTNAQRGEAYAALLEAELFDANADAHGSIRVVGTRYKDRFRTFLFSLKDAKNTTLHSRIASGELAAAELAKMSNEELANDAIRQATEKARLDALHRSTLRAEEAGPLRKITHKGEVEIESDALLVRDEPGKFQTAVDRKTDAHQSISESEPAIPTQGPTSPGSDSGKGSEEGLEETGATTSDRTATRNSAPAPNVAQGSPSRLDFGDVWARSTDSKTQGDDQNDHENTESYGFDVGSPHDEAYGHDAGAEAEGAATSGADDFIDSFLDGKDDHDAGEAMVSEDATQAAARSTTPEAEPSSLARHRFRAVIWNGLMDLPDIFAFKGHVKQIAGRSIAHAPRLWTKFLPDRPLLIAGRLPTKAAVDYLLQVANAARTEILAFALEPGAIKDGATQATESDRTSFDGILKHFKDADRWGALHVSSSVKGSLIKDFYVAPLRKEDEVPLWLDMAESDCLGTNWHAKRDRDLLILVAVVIRDSLQAELVKAERAGGRHRSTTNDGAKPRQEDAGAEAAEAYDPTAGISIPLGPSSGTGTSATAPAAPGAPVAPAGFGSDALQSLLRTLGKTAPAAPANPAAMSSPAVGASSMANMGGATPPGPPPPGPPPGPPPMLVPPGGSVASNRSPLAGSWSPHPPADEAGAGAHWQPPQGYAPQGYDVNAAHMSAPSGPAAGWDQGPGWNYPPGPGMHAPPGGGAPQPAPELPEEEYPGQYNPDYLAQASAGAGRGGAAYGPRGGGHAFGHGYGQAYGHGRGRGGWRGRGW